MSNPIKNRAFNLPADAVTATLPTHWTEASNAVDWGTTQDWAGGVGRWVGGGSLPKRGHRCLLVGAGDSTVSTDSGKALADADECLYTQTVAGAALAHAAYLCVRAVVADLGANPANTRTKIEVYDGTTTVNDYVDHDDATVFDEEFLACDLSTLDTTKTWTVKVGWERLAASGTGGPDEIPRVYFDDVRAIWTPCYGPMRIVRYSDDLAAASASSITGITAGTGYSVDNVATRRSCEPYLTGTVSDGYVEFDLGSALTFNTVALIDCDFAAGETWELLTGSSSPAGTSRGFFPTHDEHNAFLEIGRISAQYVRIEFTKVSGGANKVFKIGEIVIGDSTQMQRQFGWGAAQADSFSNVVLATPFGADWRYARGERRSYEMTWENISDADAEDLRDVLDDAHGDAYPVLVIPNPGDYRCYYGHWGESFSSIEKFIDLQTPGRLTFVEQARSTVQT